MSYWKLPEEIMEEEDLLLQWVELSYLSSIKNKKKKEKKKHETN